MGKILKKDYEISGGNVLNVGTKYKISMYKKYNKVFIFILNDLVSTAPKDIIVKKYVIIDEDDRRTIEFIPEEFEYYPGVKIKMGRIRFNKKVYSKKITIL